MTLFSWIYMLSAWSAIIALKYFLLLPHFHEK